MKSVNINRLLSQLWGDNTPVFSTKFYVTFYNSRFIKL